MPHLVATGRSLGLAYEPTAVRHAADIDEAVTRVPKSGVQAFHLAASTLFIANARAFVDAIGRTRRPALYANSDFAEAGGLMPYGPDMPGALAIAGDYVARILRGARPA